MSPKSKSLAETFYRDYRPALVAFFMRRVGERSEAEDLVQDVYVRLVTAPHGYPRNAQAYIFQIAANLLRDRVRRAEVRARYVDGVRCDDFADVDTLDPHRVAGGRETLRSLITALGDMPARTREIFLLYRYEQIGRQAIADSFGISVSAVEKHIHRAVSLLSERLGEDR